MKQCKCPTCFFLRPLIKSGRVRAECRCGHPDKAYIEEFFRSRKMLKEPGFICFRHPGEFPLNMTPKWCPRERKPQEEVVEA